MYCKEEMALSDPDVEIGFSVFQGLHSQSLRVDVRARLKNRKEMRIKEKTVIRLYVMNSLTRAKMVPSFKGLVLAGRDSYLEKVPFLLVSDHLGKI